MDTASLSPAAHYLHAVVERLRDRVGAVVEERRRAAPDSDDRFRGLYITDAHATQLLGKPPPASTLAEGVLPVSHGASFETVGDGGERLWALGPSFGLDRIDLALLVVAVAPDLDPRFERLYAYLQDDVSRRRATIGLALELVGVHPGDAGGRGRFGGHGGLIDGGLVLVEEPDRPFLTRPLRAADRVAAHLLGDDRPDPAVRGFVTEVQRTGRSSAAESVAGAFRRQRVTYVRDRPGAAGMSFAASVAHLAGLGVVALDLGRIAETRDSTEVVRLALREARLRGAAVVAGPVEALAEAHTETLRLLAMQTARALLVGSQAWDPRWSDHTPLLVDAPLLSLVERGDVWRRALDGRHEAGVDPASVTMQFRLTPDQSYRAAVAASQQASLDDGVVTVEHLQAGARSQNAAGLERLARRIEPRMGWDDLVLPESRLKQLRELVARARFRDLVLDEWGMGKAAKGRGVTALFVGESGTGKTLSAEIVAGVLGLDLYVIDLSTVVDKYVGETEKNLERIFTEADQVNGVLLFDEADAIFGKRSEVRDAHDRYANVEVAYLLQRMERFDGLAILTTNLRSNVDDAFTRRLDVIVDFPMPDDDDRRRIWELNLGRGLPVGADPDVTFLAESFSLSGGNIRNIVFTAAYLAADEGSAVTMAQLIRATQSEYRKLGRLSTADEFGPYYAEIAPEGGVGKRKKARGGRDGRT